MCTLVDGADRILAVGHSRLRWMGGTPVDEGLDIPPIPTVGSLPELLSIPTPLGEECLVPPTPELGNVHGVLHGGIQLSRLEHIGRIALGDGAAGRPVTDSIHVIYLRPTPVGHPITVRITKVHTG